MSASSDTVGGNSVRQFVISIAPFQKNRFVLGWRTEGATMALEAKFQCRLNLESRTGRVALFNGLHSAGRLFRKSFDHVRFT